MKGLGTHRLSTCCALVGGLLLACGAITAWAGDHPPEAWATTLQERLAEEEYQITWQARTYIPGLDGAWHAPNRAHGFRTYFADSGVFLIPREEESPSWMCGLSLQGYGRGDEVRRLAGRPQLPSARRIALDRGPVIEWYENSHAGLKQGFTIVRPPENAPRAGDGPPPPTRGIRGRRSLQDASAEPLYLVLTLTGTLQPAISGDGQAIDFMTPEGVPTLHYAGLSITDAAGRQLRGWFEGFLEAGARGIRIVVDDHNATYPLTIDPIATSPAWTAEGDQAGAQFGAAVSSAGDVNGDGFGDVVVSAWGYDNGQASEGRAFLYLGSPSGLAPSPSWTAEGDQAGALFGTAATAAGDVNGDGYGDVVIGAYHYDNGQADEGRVFVYLGSAMGLETTASWTGEGNQAGARYGVSASTAGDVNHDGYSDIIVGAYSYDNGQLDEGQAYVYLGSATGLSESPAWTAEANQANAYFGGLVSTAGDVNGDGFSDVVVTAYLYDNEQPDEGRAYVYLGSLIGLSATPVWIAEGDQSGAEFGSSVGTAGDVNGDGYADVIVGAWKHDSGQTDEGRAYVYLGGPIGLAPTPVWSAESDQASSRFGVWVTTAGDVNGDGYCDVIVGADYFDNGETDEGRAYVFLGSASGLEPSPSWTAEGNQAGANFGWPVSTAGDVNGDGYADVIVGAWYFDGGQPDEGKAYVYFGSASGPARTPGWTSDGGERGSDFGHQVASAGDVNGDGYADLIVGAPGFDNGQPGEGRAYVFLGGASGLTAGPSWTAEGDLAGASFGASVSSAGDVNGDGYSDVVIGAPGFDPSEPGDGRAFVFLGSTHGLAGAAGWTASGDPSVIGSEFGRSVATAGDINGDGLADIIVGEPGYRGGEIDEGRASVFLGSESGLGATAAWTTEANRTNSHLGFSVGTAGDVNADGYSDVIVGAPGHDNGTSGGGRAAVYMGSMQGLATSPAWTTDGVHSGEDLGWCVSTAGDVNGDGYSDVIVGSRRYHNGEASEGRASVFLGGIAGVGADASWTVEGNQAYANLGSSVASAGDVNADGYSDILIGAQYYDNGEGREGRAQVYLGSVSGPATEPGWTAEGSRAVVSWSASSAGDINGDGYSDVILGAAYFENGGPDEGHVSLYYGNGGPGLPVGLQQRRADGTAPIALLGAVNGADGFRVALAGRSPFGPAEAKLEWELKPLGVGFDGLDTRFGPEWLYTGTDGVALDQLVSPLVDWTVYHWRARVWYRAATTPYQRYSRWLTMASNGLQEADLRTATQTPGAGRVPGDSAWPGQPLIIQRYASEQIALSWSASCSASDDDYEVYEGTLGAYYSHSARLCSTGGATGVTMTPAGGSTYYLVVPRNAEWEGSYGLRGDGSERPQGMGVCLPQLLETCP